LITTSPNFPENQSNLIAMARLSNLPKNTLLRNMPEKDKLRKAIVGGKLRQDKNPHKVHQSAKRDLTAKQQDQKRKQ
jgi:hypothetical protein